MASKVGEAYVLVHTRTRPLSPAQKRALNRDAGDAAKAWTSRFGKEVEEAADRQLGDLQRTLAETFASGDFDGLRRQFNDTSKTVDFLRANLRRLQEQKQLNSKEFDTLERQINRWEKTALEADRNLRQINDAKHFDAYLAKQEAFNSKKQRLLLADLNAEIRNNEALNRTRQQVLQNATRAWDQEFARLERETEDRERMLRSAYRLNEQFDRRRAEQDRRRLDSMRRMHATALRMNEEFTTRERQWLADRLNMHVAHLESWSRETVRHVSIVQREYERNTNGATRFTRGLSRMNRQMSRTPDIIGTMFGRGSRNNFLNFMGVMMRNLTMIPLAFSRAFAGVIDNVTSAARAFGQLAPQIGNFRAAVAVLRMPMIALGTAMVGVLATIVGMTFAVPVLFSALTMLAGSILAVAGALVIAMSAGLVALGPLLLAIAGGVAAAVVVFAAWGDAADSVKAKIIPLKEAWEELKDSFNEAVVPRIAEALGELGEFVRTSLNPLLVGLGEALAGVLEHFVALANSPAVQGVFASLGERLPAVLESFGRSLSNILIGLLGLFDAVMPQGEKLVGGFEEMTERFREFTTSADGRNRIAAWMEYAYEAAENLWESLSNIVSIIGTVGNAATQGAGGDFLQWLADATERLDKWLKTPEGQTAMTDFFADVGDFMRETKDLIFDLADAWDSMDTSKAREDLNTVIDALGTAAGAIEWLGEKMEQLRNFFTTAYEGMDEFGQRVNGIFDDIVADVAQSGEDIQAAWQEVKDFFTGIGEGIAGVFESIVGDVEQSGTDIRAAWGDLTTWFDETLADIGDWFIGLGEGIADWASGVGESLAAMPGQVSEALGEMWTGIQESWNESMTQISESVGGFVDGVVLWFEGLPERIGTSIDFLREMLYQKIEEIAVGVANLVGGFVYGIVFAFTELPGLIYEQMTLFGEAVNEGFDTAMTAVSEWFVEMGEGVRAWIDQWRADTTIWLENFVADIQAWFPMAGQAIADAFVGMGETVRTWIDDFRTSTTIWLENFVADVTQGFTDAWNAVTTWMTEMGTTISTKFTEMGTTVRTAIDNWREDVNAWMEEFVERIRTGMADFLEEMAAGFSDAVAKLVTWGEDMVSGANTAIQNFVAAVVREMASLSGAVGDAFSAAWDVAKEWWDKIVGLVTGSGPNGGNWYTRIVSGVRSRLFQAGGGIHSQPTDVTVGEAGPEAIVPLNRPLSLVDPSVRMLSALLQGKAGELATDTPTTARSIVFAEGSIVVQTMATDVVGVAEGVVDRIAVTIGN